MKKIILFFVIVLLLSFSVSAASVSDSPQILLQPVSQSADLGQTVTFRLTALGNDLSYSWQYFTGSTWVSISNSNFPYRSIVVNASRYNVLWRCVVTDSTGNSVFSDSVVITPTPSLRNWVSAAIASVANWISIVVQYVLGSEFKVLMSVSIAISLIFFVNYFVKSKFNI